jgi:hypothetical protein
MLFGRGGVNMGNRERSGSGDRSDWRFRLAEMAGGGAGMAVALLVGAFVDLGGFWPGLIAVALAIVVGILLGRFVGGLLFPPSSGGPPDHSLHA